MLLINTHIFRHFHVSYDVVTEFEKAILSDSGVKPVKPGSQSWFRLLYYMDKVIRKARIHLVEILARFFILDSSDKKEAYFAALIGQDFVKVYPYLFLNRKKRYIYFFDAWTKDLPLFVDFIRQCKIDRIFVSSSQAVNGLNEKLGRPIAEWIPDGIDITAYKQIPYDQKDIDVIQIGRKYDTYHEQILPFFNDTNRVYLYEKTKGTVIFPNREDFINGLARSKISICFPSSITHPERSGAMETMTNRYLQSIASKCLIIGHAPKEMIELFGYNPVVEIDPDAPVEQLNTILNHYTDYIPLIEKNYEMVSKYHTWKNRWEQIKDRINLRQE
jgi:glycosyltransferase involved in cell wall biosynthesis